MPNHVTSRIKFSTAEAFDLFKSKYVTGVADDGSPTEESFDFNKLIPMPEGLDIEAGSRTEDGICVVLDELKRSGIEGSQQIIDTVIAAKRKENIFSSFGPLSTSELVNVITVAKKNGFYDDMVKAGKQAIKNIVDTGYSDWYHWSIANWGTKWNSYSYGDSRDDLEVFFQTAWDAPKPVIEKLIDEMPAGSIAEYEYADEDIGNNVGHYDPELGMVFPYENGSDEAMEVAVRLNGAEEYYRRNEDGTWEYVEEE